jgi:putative transposase
MDIFALFRTFCQVHPATVLRQLSAIIAGALCAPQHITMRNIARWSTCSYRTIQRFFATPIHWPSFHTAFVTTHLHDTSHPYILAFDETTITKSGKKTYGIDRYFSGTHGHMVKGLSFGMLAVVDGDARRSYPVHVTQIVHSSAKKSVVTTPKRPRGRPLGSRNKPLQDQTRSPELTRIDAQLTQFLHENNGIIPLRYIALDGHFGNIPTLELVQQHGLHIITKLRSDSKLFFPHHAPYSGRGRPKVFGKKVDIRTLSDQYCVHTSHNGGIQTQLFQFQARVKASTQLLNIVVRRVINHTKNTRTDIILMSSDLALGATQLVEYYGLRFQIEFNFRDAKQHFGLEDFMNITPTAVHNAANLAMCMVNVSAKLIAYSDGTIDGVRDLKTALRGRKYIDMVLKILPPAVQNVLKIPLEGAFLAQGRINAPPNDRRAA